MYKSLKPQPRSLLSNSVHPFPSENICRPRRLYLSCLKCSPAEFPLHFFYTLSFHPTFFFEMISKSFPIQAFVALLTIASSLTSPVNAAAVIPGRQFLFLIPIDREALC